MGGEVDPRREEFAERSLVLLPADRRSDEAGGGRRRAHRHLPGPCVFCDECGARLAHGKVKRVVPGACAKAGLGKRLTTLGHTTVEMTMRCAHTSPDVKRDAVRLLDELPVARSSPGVGAGVERVRPSSRGCASVMETCLETVRNVRSPKRPCSR
jgi:hypothetical protein